LLAAAPATATTSKVCALGIAEMVAPTAFELRPTALKISFLESLDGKTPAQVHKALEIRDGAVPVWGNIIGIQPVTSAGNGGGLENFGIYFYKDASGREHAVKILDFGPRIAVGNDLRQTLLGSYLMEEAGGPRIYDFGTAELTVGGEKYVHYYLDMEKLPSGTSLKKLQASEVSAAFPDPAARAKLPERVAKLLAAVLAKGISPSDPDVWLMPDGEARWIDGPRWRRTDFPKADCQYLAQVTWFLLQKMSHLDGAKFLDTFVKELKGSGLSPDIQGRLRHQFADLREVSRNDVFSPDELKKILAKIGLLETSRVDLPTAQAALESHLRDLLRP